MAIFITISNMLLLLAIYVAWQRANTLQAKHRAQTRSILDKISRLPATFGLEANASGTRWQG